MNTVELVIPVKKILVKFLNFDITRLSDSEKSYWDIFVYNNQLYYLFYTFQKSKLHFIYYKIHQENLKTLFVERKLFRKARKNAKLPDYVKGFSVSVYDYLIFTIPVSSKKIDENKNSYGYLLTIEDEVKDFNMILEYQFWDHAIRAIIYGIRRRKKRKLNDLIDSFYHSYKLTDSDYKKSSFKTGLYDRRNQNRMIYLRYDKPDLTIEEVKYKLYHCPLK